MITAALIFGGVAAVLHDVGSGTASYFNTNAVDIQLTDRARGLIDGQKKRKTKR